MAVTTASSLLLDPRDTSFHRLPPRKISESAIRSAQIRAADISYRGFGNSLQQASCRDQANLYPFAPLFCKHRLNHQYEPIQHETLRVETCQRCKTPRQISKPT